LCDNLGQQEEAIRYYEKAIAAGTHLDDLPYADLGTMLNNVALIFRRSGRQKAAEPYYLHALQIYEKQLGPQHADVASVLNNLAVFYTNEKRYAEAEKTHLRALGIREKVFPSTHPDIAQSKCNLAVVYHSRGDYPKAAELYRAEFFELTWRNWQTRTAQDRMGQPVEVRVLSRAICPLTVKLSVFAGRRNQPVLGVRMRKIGRLRIASRIPRGR